MSEIGKKGGSVKSEKKVTSQAPRGRPTKLEKEFESAVKKASNKHSCVTGWDLAQELIEMGFL